MPWRVDDFWRWWSQQPEILEAERAQRHRDWQIRKTQDRITRAEQKLWRAGVSRRDINMLKRLSGVTPAEIERELSGRT